MKNLLLTAGFIALMITTTSCTTVTEIDKKSKITTEVTRFMGIVMKTKAISVHPKY
jgi:ribosomal protein S6